MSKGISDATRNCPESIETHLVLTDVSPCSRSVDHLLSVLSAILAGVDAIRLLEAAEM